MPAALPRGAHRLVQHACLTRPGGTYRLVHHACLIWPERAYRLVHYARIEGKTETDRTSVGLYLAPGPPERVLHRMDLRNFFMQIPAGAASHEVKRCYDFEKDKLLLSFTPHMHYRGKDMTYELVRPNGKREILLSVPRYDFGWQANYILETPLHLPAGTKISSLDSSCQGFKRRVASTPLSE